MKAADIPDSKILEVIAKAEVWASRWDIQKAFLGFPPKVIDAKLRALKKRGLISGCTEHHDCRGDFEIKQKSTAK